MERCTSSGHPKEESTGVSQRSRVVPRGQCLFQNEGTLRAQVSVVQCESESEVTQSCLTLCDPMDYSPPGLSIRGIFQARVLEWVAISFYRGSSWPRDWTQVSHIAGRCFTIWATRVKMGMMPYKLFICWTRSPLDIFNIVILFLQNYFFKK